MTEDKVMVSVRVRQGLLAQGIAAVLALSVPVLLALYWLTIPSGSWVWVAVAHAFVIAFLVYSIIRYLRVRVTVTPTHLVEHRFFWGTTRVPFEDIDRVVMLEMHRTMASQSRLQMFVLDASGQPLVRMRGEYWSRNGINRIASHLTMAPIEHIDHPVTLDELQATRPEMLYWFERRPRRMP
ncbi:hypothetical protein D9V29_01975 [Mycetocola manganoxydans]|uniref:PH domain-containing protein n=1 Tax=Mycetocola manganoxydans TaxID=699879 RepID=A0A3L6ZZK8_9MICO|nr:hypothetical protein [Mycetocola manganoxydans]RLP73476.1 hypothetical protein D9V29_01975 [Mycetocola manganoxydans]GHD41541.1 hypothetical protein GCM10008097_06360 [Mycetocola manganoxydans]